MDNGIREQDGDTPGFDLLGIHNKDPSPDNILQMLRKLFKFDM